MNNVVSVSLRVNVHSKVVQTMTIKTKHHVMTRNHKQLNLKKTKLVV